MVQYPNQSCQPVVDVNVTPTFKTTRIFTSKRKRTPKSIQVDESELNSMEGKVDKCTILRHCSQIMKQYFDNKFEADKCYLFLALLKSKNMATVRRNLGITTMKNIESSNQIVKSLAAAFTSIGKKLVQKTVMWLVVYWLNQLYVDPQGNVVYLNAHQKLFLYIQRLLKNVCIN